MIARCPRDAGGTVLVARRIAAAATDDRLEPVPSGLADGAAGKALVATTSV